TTRGFPSGTQSRRCLLRRPSPAAFAKRSLHAAVDATSLMAADWTSARRAWEKWTGKHVGSSGMPIKAALLLNYDPTGPSRLFPMVAEQEGAKFTAVDLQPSMDFFRRNNLQTEFFSIGSNQYVVTSIHEHWFSARCVNTTQPGGEGVIIMQIGAYLLVSMYDGSVGSASRAMVAVDQFAWHFNRKTH
uniref:Profilin n=3 Tax=Triticinae TaxID=1648030 RepID=A0A452YDE3_AEGTS